MVEVNVQAASVYHVGRSMVRELFKGAGYDQRFTYYKQGVNLYYPNLDNTVLAQSDKDYYKYINLDIFTIQDTNVLGQ